MGGAQGSSEALSAPVSTSTGSKEEQELEGEEDTIDFEVGDCAKLLRTSVNMALGFRESRESLERSEVSCCCCADETAVVLPPSPS